MGLLGDAGMWPEGGTKPYFGLGAKFKKTA
jgi:hypothetical protein